MIAALGDTVSNTQRAAIVLDESPRDGCLSPGLASFQKEREVSKSTSRHSFRYTLSHTHTLIDLVHSSSQT